MRGWDDFGLTANFFAFSLQITLEKQWTQKKIT